MRRVVRLKGVKIIVKPNGTRYVYRRVKGGLVPLPDLPENDPRFLKAYIDAETALPPSRSRAATGTIAALCVSFKSSAHMRSLAPTTQRVFARLVDKLSEKAGTGMARDLEPRHIRKDIAGMTPGAARNRLKVWRAVLEHGVATDVIESNPATNVKLAKSKTKPHHQWTRDEIAQYRKHWPQGVPERQAMEVIFWTGARCVDAVRLGRQMVSDGWLSFTQAKTGGPASCPINALPKWAKGMAEDHAHFIAALPSDRLQWIVTRSGKPRSVKALSQFISKAASSAGLSDQCTAHGLRKARAAAIAESGGTAHQIGAWTGHASLTEIAHYTRESDQISILRGTEQKRKTGNRLKLVSKKDESPL